MPVVKVIEVLAEGKTIEDAVNTAVAEASRTVHGIKNIYLKDIQALVENNKVAKYRVNTKISFVIEH